MAVLSLTDYRPSPRFDDKPWIRARIEQTVVDPPVWTLVEQVDLDPVDTDPAHPAYRSFTTELASPLALSFRIVFADTDGDEQPTTAIPAVSAEVRAWRPTIREVATLLRARTKDEFGNYLGTFNETTRPTGDEVEACIDQAVEDVLGVFVATDVPVDSQDQARRAGALKAALYIEMSYFPEQGGDNSPYLQLRALSDMAMTRLINRAILLDGFGEDPPPVFGP